MDSNTLTYIDQIAFVVDDMDKAKATIKKIFGAEPYRENQASETRHRMAFYQFANIELELIMPDERSDIQSEYLKQHGKGIHHIRFDVDDYQQTLQNMAERGYPAMSEADSVRKKGVKIAYFDTEPELGIYLELINMRESIKQEEEWHK